MRSGMARVGIEAITSHRDVIDVRTPAEFAIDHIPGATNLPVLSDAERVEVGTLHAQVSPFAARRRGAALVARNIAAILDMLADQPREFAPLVYCWRGGQRSRSLVHVMNEVGWRAVALQDGYKAWRTHVIENIDRLGGAPDYRVVCGLTGSGKSHLIEALGRAGAQVLDLESLARHRGSLLGDLPGDPQPSQKAFETGLMVALQAFDPARPVFVESESRRIGRVQVPDSILARMRASPAIRIEMPLPLRVELLMRDYDHFIDDTAALEARLAPLVPLCGRAAVEHWLSLSRAGHARELVHALLSEHYDPTYARAIQRNFPRNADAQVVALSGIEAADFDVAAHQLIGAVR